MDIGPPTDAGFYYDFDSEVPFTPEVLQQIEEEMKKVIKENQRFERLEVSREEAISIIQEMGQTTYKLGRLDDIPEGETISFYRNGEFRDLCAGSHVSYTKKIKAFKLLHVAGSYHRGDSSQKQLQRIYGTAFLERRTCPTPGAFGGGKKEGSPCGGKRSWSLSYRRTGRTGPRALEAQRSHYPAGIGGVHYRTVKPTRDILRSIHPTYWQTRSLPHLWSFPLLSGLPVPTNHPS